jgi:hypothetical protein
MQQALADGCLAGVDARCHDLDEHLARTRNGLGDFDDLEDVNVSVFVESHC